MSAVLSVSLCVIALAMLVANFNDIKKSHSNDD